MRKERPSTLNAGRPRAFGLGPSPITDSGRLFRALLLAPRGASRLYIDEIIALIRGGMTGAEACAAKPDYPNYRSLTEWAEKNGRMADISAAWRGREKSDSARMKTNLTYTEAQYDAAIELLTRNPRKSLRQQAKALSVDLPSRETIYLRKSRDPAFAERFEAATKNIRSVVSRHTPATPRPIYRSGLLRAALLRSELYRAAKKAVPFTQHSEDIIQEICLAVLDGKLQREDIATKGNKFAWARIRVPLIESLDQPVFERDERMSRVDMMTTNEILFY